MNFRIVKNTLNEDEKVYLAHWYRKLLSSTKLLCWRNRYYIYGGGDRTKLTFPSIFDIKPTNTTQPNHLKEGFPPVPPLHFEFFPVCNPMTVTSQPPRALFKYLNRTMTT